MFDNLGIEWAATLLGCLAAICVPIPVCFYLFGKKLRQKSKFAPTMKPPKKDEEDFESGSDDDHQHDMSALHATRSMAHHELPSKGRTRTRTNGTSGSAPIGGVDMNRAKQTKDAANEKQE
jgi:hypothetical protein